MNLDLLTQRIEQLETALAPFAKLGGKVGFQAAQPDTSLVLSTLAGALTVGDFRRAAAALRNATLQGAQHG